MSSLQQRPVWLVLLAGCLIAMIGFGVRASFGLFLEPMTAAKGWSRETFSIMMAIQNLLWGAGVPVAGALADRFGPVRVIAGGAVAYAIGVLGMAMVESIPLLYVLGGVIAGLGIAFTAFSLAMAAMARVVGPERRSLALGLGTAAGSFGQVVFSPLGQYAINAHGWYPALIMMALATTLLVPLAMALPREPGAGVAAEPDRGLRVAMGEALSHRGYVLLTTGFFVCGFHVAFIGVHFPAYASDLGLAPEVGAVSLALIGGFNIVGSLLSGWAGQRFSMKSSLSLIYTARSAAIFALLMADKTATTLYLFAAVMGLLWLSTVPLTTGIVAQVFGVRYLATLFGVVFFSHQIGSFIGIWLGGWLVDHTGSYDAMWWAGVVLGLAAAIVHWPIDERPLVRAPA